MALIAAGIIGAGASIGGGILSDQNARSSANGQQDAADKMYWYQQDRLGQQQQNLLAMLYGAGYSNRGIAGRGAGAYGDGSLLSRMQGTADQFRTNSGNIMNSYGADTQSLLGHYRDQTGQLDSMAAGAEGMAKQWGAGREQTIRTDAANSLKDANRMGDAALAAGGFNSPTYRANQYAQNAAANQLNTQRSLQDLGGQQIDRQLAARSSRMGMLGDRYGNETSLAASRASGDTQMRTGFLGSQTQLDAMPMNTELSVWQGGIMNPWGDQQSRLTGAQGGNGLGSALSSLGNTAAGLGAWQYAQNSQNNNLTNLLRQYQFGQTAQGGRNPSPFYGV